MEVKEEEKRINPYMQKEKGCVLSFKNRSIFIKSGDRYKDLGGKLYLVAEDGSLRRVKDA